MANRSRVPLYRCSDCGFVTTASQANAVRAHAEGTPDCAGRLEMIADFKRTPVVVLPGARRRRQSSAQGPDRPAAPPPR
jgi:hypothetical protein